MISERLKSLREDADLSQKELAKALGVSPSTIGMYESGKRTPDSEMLTRICDFFNITVDYLLGRSNVKKPLNIDPLFQGAGGEKFSEAVETIAAHLEEKNKEITPRKMKLLKRYIDDLFDDFDD